MRASRPSSLLPSASGSSKHHCCGWQPITDQTGTPDPTASLLPRGNHSGCLAACISLLHLLPLDLDSTLHSWWEVAGWHAWPLPWCRKLANMSGGWGAHQGHPGAVMAAQWLPRELLRPGDGWSPDHPSQARPGNNLSDQEPPGPLRKLFTHPGDFPPKLWDERNHKAFTGKKKKKN